MSSAADSPRVLRIGCGSANDRDRPELAVQMLERGDVSYLCFDTLAERTLAFAQLRKQQDPTSGYNPLLRERMRTLLAPARERGVRLVGNFGGANPEQAGKVVLEEAAAAGVDELCVGVVTGDDVLDFVRARGRELEFWETGGGTDTLPGEVVCANVYLGAGPIVAALSAGADVVVTGRSSDLAPYLAVAAYEFGWRVDAWDLLAGGSMVGHLLECGRYITGAYFAEPAYGKEVPGGDDLALPLAEVREDGTAVISKPPGTGGFVTVATCKEQLVYEVHDPARYVSPDVTIDIREATVTDAGPDRVAVSGVRGTPRPETLKALVGVAEGWIAEGEISFAGPGAVAKAEQTAAIVRAHVERSGAVFDELRTDLIGLNSIHDGAGATGAEPYEVRLRIAGRARQKEHAEALAAECDDMWFVPPQGGGGVRTQMRQVLAMYSALVPRDEVPVGVELLERRKLVGSW